MNSNQIPQIFDSNRVKWHRARAAANFSEHDFLFREMAENICERLSYIKRNFPVVLDLGAKTGVFSQLLQNNSGVETLVQAELSCDLLSKSSGLKVVANEELLPFAENSFDLVVSVGSLHWVNDLAGTLSQIQHILKSDGLFIAVIFGVQTLKELRASFEKAEIEARGGISPRISPFIDVQTGGSLLQRAGFTLPVVDSEVLTVEYNHPLKLMKELRGMGETNAMRESSKNFTPCSLLMSAVDHYIRDFSNDAGRINSSFELITLTGWKAHASQQKPARRGSGVMPFSAI